MEHFDFGVHKVLNAGRVHKLFLRDLNPWGFLLSAVPPLPQGDVKYTEGECKAHSNHKNQGQLR